MAVMILSDLYIFEKKNDNKPAQKKRPSMQLSGDQAH